MESWNAKEIVSLSIKCSCDDDDDGGDGGDDDEWRHCFDMSIDLEEYAII